MKIKQWLGALLCMLLCMGLMPATAFATGEPVISNLTVTRDSETTATITFDSTQSGSVAIAVKNGDGTFGLYIGDKDGVIAGKNTIKLENLEGTEEKEIAIYFGTDESDFYELLMSQNPLDMPGAVKGTVPAVHTCAGQGDWQYGPDSHWKLCGTCGNRVDEAAHSGGTATCKAQAVCDVCKQPYGSVDSSNHATGTIVWTQTENTHSGVYECCGATAVAAESHTWKDGVCSECGYGCQHVFQWVTDKEPTETQAGSEHKECMICGYAKAPVRIPAMGTTGEPSTPSQPGDVTPPQTGDGSNAALWVGLMLAAGAALAGALLYSRKKKYSR